jgi:hypothetical protein
LLPGATALFLAVVTVACSPDSRVTACDQSPNPETAEQAVSILLDAAFAGDPQLACTAIADVTEDEDIQTALADLKSEAQQRGLESGTAELQQVATDGSVRTIEVLVPDPASGPLRFEVVEQEISGYRVDWPSPDDS